VLGLPDHVTACLFDLDGVLTPTAKVHNAAWTSTFDGFLRSWADRHHKPYVPFDSDADYNEHVDGKPRSDGVRDFLASRDIHLPEGEPDDPTDQPPGSETVTGLGNRKNAEVLTVLKTSGVEAYPGSRRYLEAARDAGLRRAVVSASANCADVVSAAKIADLLEARVDGVTARAEHLRGKPQPDSFLAGAAKLGVAKENAAVFEDALSGVEAGRAGRFGFVVGVDRLGGDHGKRLREHGADVVVRDLAELLDGGPVTENSAGARS
jgi:beta-phosphoglucomutase family hydrolase